MTDLLMFWVHIEVQWSDEVKMAPYLKLAKAQDQKTAQTQAN